MTLTGISRPFMLIASGLVTLSLSAHAVAAPLVAAAGPAEAEPTPSLDGEGVWLTNGRLRGTVGGTETGRVHRVSLPEQDLLRRSSRPRFGAEEGTARMARLSQQTESTLGYAYALAASYLADTTVLLDIIVPGGLGSAAGTFRGRVTFDATHMTPRNPGEGHRTAVGSAGLLEFAMECGGTAAPGIVHRVVFDVIGNERMARDSVRISTAPGASGEATAVPVSWQTRLVTGGDAHLGSAYAAAESQGVWIPYQLGKRSSIAVVIRDVLGAPIRVLDAGSRHPGSYLAPGLAIYWDGRNARGSDVGNATYVAELRVGDVAWGTREIAMR